jgi:large subunit ribosomal protein L23
MTPADCLKALIRTEKSTATEPQGKYLFLVNIRANKIQIRKAVEEAYKVKVQDVNTVISAGKLKRVRQQLGKTPDTKKAIVTLRRGEKIEVA